MTAVQNYRVQSGDTVSGIAARHGVSPEALMRANGMNPGLADGRIGRGSADPDRLQVGQQLRIPVATPGLEREHRVVAGETLAGIADHWDVSLKDLLAANPQFDASKVGAQRGHGAGRDPDRLTIGDVIHRPGAASNGAGHPTAALPPAAAANAPGAGRTAATAPANAPTATAAAAATTAAGANGAPRIDLRAFTNPALGSSAPAAIVIGNAEGTRRPDGGFTAAFGGHTDPGNAVHNRGSFSYQHAATSPADADRRQLTTLQGQLPAYETAARNAGLDAGNPRLAAAYLDLHNQSPTAAQRFLNQLGTLRDQPITTATLTNLRVNSFVDSSTGTRFRLDNGGLAGSGFANIARTQLDGRTPTEAQVQAVIRADQQRRTNALETAMNRQGLLTPATTAAPTTTAPAATNATAAAGAADTPRWLSIARGELGTHEIRGAQHESRVVEYHQATSLKAKDDETSWCSSFVNWTMQQAGVTGTNSAAARSWLNWGQAVPIDAAHVKPGDVIVFPRGNNPAQGHVAIVSEVLDNGKVRVLGGNQGVRGEQYDGVTYADRALNTAIGVRRAP